MSTQESTEQTNPSDWPDWPDDILVPGACDIEYKVNPRLPRKATTSLGEVMMRKALLSGIYD